MCLHFIVLQAYSLKSARNIFKSNNTIIQLKKILFLPIFSGLTFSQHKKSLKIPKGGNHNPPIEDGQSTQWPKEKVQKNKQQSTKHTHKTKGRVTQTLLRAAGELRCSGRVNSSCFTTGTRGVNLITNPVLSHKRCLFSWLTLI